MIYRLPVYFINIMRSHFHDWARLWQTLRSVTMIVGMKSKHSKRELEEIQAIDSAMATQANGSIAKQAENTGAVKEHVTIAEQAGFCRLNFINYISWKTFINHKDYELSTCFRSFSSLCTNSSRFGRDNSIGALRLHTCDVEQSYCIAD